MENLFYNEKIFNSYRDFVLGGFEYKKDMVVDFNTIVNEVKSKIRNLIIKYYNDTLELSMQRKDYLTTDYTIENAKNNIGLLFYDCFQYYPKYTEVDLLVDEICNTENMQIWLYDKIKTKVENYPLSFRGDLEMGIPNVKWIDATNKNLVEDCIDVSENMSIDLYFEQLSNIE